MSLGLVTVPLYTDDRPDNIAYITGDAAVKVLLVQDASQWKRLAPALAGQEDLQRVLLLDDTHTATREVLEDARARLEREIVTIGGLGEVRIDRAGLGAVPTPRRPGTFFHGGSVMRRTGRRTLQFCVCVCVCRR